MTTGGIVNAYETEEKLLRQKAIDAALAYHRHAHGRKPFSLGDRIPYAAVRREGNKQSH